MHRLFCGLGLSFVLPFHLAAADWSQFRGPTQRWPRRQRQTADRMGQDEERDLAEGNPRPGLVVAGRGRRANLPDDRRAW